MEAALPRLFNRRFIQVVEEERRASGVGIYSWD